MANFIKTTVWVKQFLVLFAEVYWIVIVIFYLNLIFNFKISILIHKKLWDIVSKLDVLDNKSDKLQNNKNQVNILGLFISFRVYFKNILFWFNIKSFRRLFLFQKVWKFFQVLSMNWIIKTTFYFYRWNFVLFLILSLFLFVFLVAHNLWYICNTYVLFLFLRILINMANLQFSIFL